MIRSSASVLIALSLSACASLPADGGMHAKVLQANVHTLAQRKTLPNGKDYCYEDSELQRDLDACTLDLEDLAFRRQQQVDAIVEVIDKYVGKKWWQFWK